MGMRSPALGIVIVIGLGACPAKDEAGGNDGAGTDTEDAGTAGSEDATGSGGSADDTVGGEALVVECGAAPLGAVGAEYTHTLVASGGAPPYAWLPTANLPMGLAVDASDGVIAGTPVDSGEFAAMIMVTDAAGAMATTTCAITINEPLQIDASIDPTDPAFCITGTGSLLDLVPEGAGDGSPIQCSHTASPGNGRMPEGIAIDPDTCRITGRLAETRYGTWAFIVRGEQNGAQMFAPYCVTQARPGFAYDVAVAGTGLLGATGPIVRQFDPDAPLEVGERGDPIFTITDPASCDPAACYFGFAFALAASAFDANTFELPNRVIVFDGAGAAIGFSHELSIGGPAVPPELRTRPWVHNVSLDYCLAADTEACSDPGSVLRNGDGHLELSILMVPQ